MHFYVENSLLIDNFMSAYSIHKFLFALGIFCRDLPILRSSYYMPLFLHSMSFFIVVVVVDAADCFCGVGLFENNISTTCYHVQFVFILFDNLRTSNTNQISLCSRKCLRIPWNELMNCVSVF